MMSLLFISPLLIFSVRSFIERSQVISLTTSYCCHNSPTDINRKRTVKLAIAVLFGFGLCLVVFCRVVTGEEYSSLLAPLLNSRLITPMVSKGINRYSWGRILEKYAWYTVAV